MRFRDYLFYGVVIIVLIALGAAHCARQAECDGKGGVLVRGSWGSSCVELKRIKLKGED